MDSGKSEESEEVKSVKGIHLSLHVIARRNISSRINGGKLQDVTQSQDQLLTCLEKVTHVRLDRERIQSIDNLELLGPSVTNLYLQCNMIRVIENLDCLSNLTFLMLANNRIYRVENLLSLRRLKFLDLSDNMIDKVDIDELPQSLIILNLSGNTCISLPDHRGRMIQDLPNLRQLDKRQVTKQERVECGFVVSSDSDENSEDEDQSDDEDVTTIKGVFKATTDEIKLRSKFRMSEVLDEHWRRESELDEIRHCQSTDNSNIQSARWLDNQSRLSIATESTLQTDSRDGGAPNNDSGTTPEQPFLARSSINTKSDWLPVL